MVAAMLPLLILMQKAKTSWLKQSDFLFYYLSLIAVVNVNGKRFV